LAGSEKGMVVGLDVGASGIAVAVLNSAGGTGQEIAGLGHSPSVGFDKGRVASLDDAVGSVRRAVANAELAAGTNISFVYLCIDLPGMAVKRGSAGRIIEGEKGITRRELLETQRDVFYPPGTSGDHAIVQLVDNRYYIDGKLLDRPLGMKGRELTVEAAAVVAGSEDLEKLNSCFRTAGLKIKQTLAGPLAAAEAVLSGVERELGVVLVDIGAGLTRVAYINQGSIIDMDVFPAGSGHITSDLALVLHTTLDEAETIKTGYGLAQVEGHVRVRPVSGTGERAFPGDLVNRVVHSRVDEILGFVARFVRKLNLTDTLPGGAVLTGGGSLLAGLPELAQKHLAMPVRLGNCRVAPESVPEGELYRYTNAIGAALWGARKAHFTSVVKGRLRRGSIVSRLFNWLQ